MERKIPQSVGDVLRNLLDETSLQGRMDELKAADLWPSVVGSQIASQCRKPVVRNGIMSIGIPNASLRNELHFNRSRMIAIINDMIGKKIIQEIKFVS